MRVGQIRRPFEVRAESNAMVEPKVKGVAFRSIAICFSELFGERLRDEARAHMYEELGRCRGWDENMWCELVGSCESLLEIADARHVRSHVVQGGRDGNDEMTMESRWA
jgi:hypothetical protein